jgi:HEAT repeat protein
MGYFGPTGLPKASTGSGISKLESALLSLLDIADRSPAAVHYAIFALGKLEGFPILSPETLARLAEYVPSARPVPAFAAIRLILRTKSPQGAELLKQYLDDHEGESLQDGGMAWVSQVRDPCALPTLEALTRSKYRQVRAGAISALQGIRSPTSIPVLMKRLNESDDDERYWTVTALAAVVGFAPPWEEFNRDPDKYSHLWKNWLAKQSNAFGSIRGPDSVPVLVERLDSADLRVRYFAMMRLGQGLGIAPRQEDFRRDPDKSVAIWKKWWAEHLSETSAVRIETP